MIAAELSFARLRDEAERGHLRRQVLALRSVAAASDPPALLETLVGHIAQGSGAEGAWIWTAASDGTVAVTHARGRVPPGVERPRLGDWGARPGEARPLAEVVSGARDLVGLVIPLASDPQTVLGVAFERVPFGSERRAFVRDLAADAGPLLAAAYAQVRQRERSATFQSTLAAASAIVAQQTEAGVLAELVVGANAVAGRAAVARLADGSIVTGDAPTENSVELARDDDAAIAIVQGVAVVPLGEGRALVAAKAARAPEEHELAALRRLGEFAAVAIDRIREREELAEAARALRGDVERIGGALRAREDAVATAVHELRNPLTSVQGYSGSCRGTSWRSSARSPSSTGSSPTSSAPAGRVSRMPRRSTSSRRCETRSTGCVW